MGSLFKTFVFKRYWYFSAYSAVICIEILRFTLYLKVMTCKLVSIRLVCGTTPSNGCPYFILVCIRLVVLKIVCNSGITKRALSYPAG